ncbi:uncharacterized protein LOC141890280 isoform X2 [Acropora palmata]|uniref:uncharacterized protein LOC141890280 isoform X2 n=1 Tax=Acropora palmata TaxID=6131 RepID=UPI003DA16E34
MEGGMQYTLDFQNQWGHRQLVRKGGERSPLERELRIAKQDQYGNIVYDPNMVVPETYDFVVSTVTGNIIPNLSSGLSTYTAEKYLPENFKEKQERLWKLKNVATYYKETISLTYPKEMELHPDPDDENHFGIRPVENVDVQPAKFRQCNSYGDISDNSRKRSVTYHKIPSAPELKKLWLQRITREESFRELRHKLNIQNGTATY